MGCELTHPHVGRLLCLSIGPQIERNAIKPHAVPGRMVCQHPFISFFPLYHMVQIAVAPSYRIPRHIPIVVEIGRNRDQKRHRIRPGNRNTRRIGLQRTAFGYDLCHRSVPYLPGNGLMIVRTAVYDQPSVPLRCDRIVFHRRPETHPKRNPIPLGSGQPHHNHRIGKGRKHFASVLHLPNLIGDRRYGPFQIQLPIILRKGFVSGKIEEQRSGRLIGHPM